MTEYDRGFRDGVEAAAKIADDSILGSVTRDPPWVWLAIVRDRIRTLAPPSPEPATPDPDLTNAETGRPFREPVLTVLRFIRAMERWRPKSNFFAITHRGCTVTVEWKKQNRDDAPATGPERCGHRGFEWENTVTKRCIRCGAKWRDDGCGWRSP